MGQKIASITLLLSLVVAVRTEALPQYHITDLGVLPGYDYSVATAINDLGQVVGYSWYSDPTRNIRKQAFLWTREAGMIGLGFLPEGVDSSEATSINNHGVVVGTANYTYGPDQYGIFTEVGTAFRWTRDGGMQNLHSLPPGYFGSSGTAINDNGLIIAQTGNFATSRNAVISDGVAGFRQVFPEAPLSAAAAINNHDLILGWYDTIGDVNHPTPQYAVISDTQGHIIYTLDANPLGTNLVLYDLNNNNQALVFTDNGFVRNTLLWSTAAGFQALGDEYIGLRMNDQADIVAAHSLWTTTDGWRDLRSLAEADAITYLDCCGVTDINNAGQITGTGLDAMGLQRAYVLTPIPGASQEHPILPTSPAGAPFLFNNVSSDKWFDPPLVPSFTYTAQPGTLFSQILDFPTGFSSPFTVAAEGSTLGQFGPGESVSFAGFPGGGLSSFTISGINPLVDSENPLGFPLRIGFTTPTGSFVMIGVPEPSTAVLLAAGVAGLLTWRRKPPRKEGRR